MPDKAEQSRINGAKSNGPTSAEGKEKVSQNATKHGCYSYRVVIRGESEEIYKQFYLAYWAEYKPETPSETDAVEDIINTRWKIRRLETIETNYYSMAAGLYQDNQDFHDASPDTQQRACFNHLIETQPGFEACAKFLERYQQEDFLILNKADDFNAQRGSLSTWLCGIARRQVWKQLRARHRHLAMPLDEDVNEIESLDDDPSEILTRKEALLAVAGGE